MILTTERLLLRPWEERDAESLYEYCKDPRIGPAAGWPPHKSVEQSREILRDFMVLPETYAICLREAGDGAPGDPIGCVQIKLGENTDMTDRDDEGEIGYWIGVPYWGNGYMPEAVRELCRHAFEDLGFSAIWCGYYEGNDKSRRVQEKCGFVYHHTSEGLEVPRLGEVRTGYANLLTRADWERQNIVETGETV